MSCVPLDAPEAASPIDGKCVLVVEDEVFIAIDLEYALADAGADVAVKQCVDSSMSYLEEKRPDVAILDVNLGYNITCAPVAKRLRSLGIPFIIHSGDYRAQGELIESFGVPIVEKPSSVDVILRRLSEVI